MLDKIKALMSLFKQGSSVADPAKWKAHQITVTMLGGLIIAIVQTAKAFGHEIPIDAASASALAGGVIAAVNVVLTLITSKSVGLPQGAVREAQQALPSDAQADTHGEASDEPAPVQPVDEAPAEQPSADAIDEATRQRAREWVRQHSVTPSIANSNGLASDA